MRTSISILFLWVALAVPLSLRAQGSEVERQAAALQEQGPALQSFLRRNREGQVDSQYSAEILRGAKALEDQGLPSEPYLLKANEGLAKRVGPKQLAPALQSTSARTREAATLVDGAVAQGASASPESRRRAILQFQSALMSGRSTRDLEKKIQAGLVRERKPSLNELVDESFDRGSREKKSIQKPDLPKLGSPPDSEKPVKAKLSPQGNSGKKSSELGKPPAKQKPSVQKPAKSKSSIPLGHGGNSRGKGSGKGRGK